MPGRTCQGPRGYLCGPGGFLGGICGDFMTPELTNCGPLCMLAKITRLWHIYKHTERLQAPKYTSFPQINIGFPHLLWKTSNAHIHLKTHLINKKTLFNHYFT